MELVLFFLNALGVVFLLVAIPTAIGLLIAFIYGYLTRNKPRYHEVDLRETNLDFLRQEIEKHKQIGYEQCSDITLSGSFYEVEMRKRLLYDSNGKPLPSTRLDIPRQKR